MNSITNPKETPYKVSPIVDASGRPRCLAVIGPNVEPAYYGDFKRTDAEVFAYTLNQAFKAGREFEAAKVKKPAARKKVSA